MKKKTMYGQLVNKILFVEFFCTFVFMYKKIKLK